MALSNWQRTIVNEYGEVIPAAEVTVTNEATSEVANIFSDRAGTIPLANPFTCGADGFAEFYVGAGEYKVDAVGITGSQTWRYEVVLDVNGGFKTSSEVFDATQKAMIAGATTKNTEQDGRLTSLESTQANHSGRITQNESDISALEQEVEEILQGQDLDPNKDTEVLAARVSSVTGVTHPSIGDRMDGFEEKQNVFDDGGAVVGYMKYIARDGHLVIQTEDV